MKRREALKKIGLTAGFVVATPAVFSLLQSCKDDSKKWIPSFVTEEQKIILNNLTEIILPKTEGLPGALDVNVPQFIDKYINEILDAEDQGLVKQAFSKIVGLLKPNAESKIEDVTPEQYMALLDKHMRIKGEIDEERKANPEAEIMTNSEFLNQVKWMTINAYKTSEKIGEEVLVYEPVPTTYYCGDLQELTGGKSYSLK